MAYNVTVGLHRQRVGVQTLYCGVSGEERGTGEEKGTEKGTGKGSQFRNRCAFNLHTGSHGEVRWWRA
jgi:hypothetical protein